MNGRSSGRYNDVYDHFARFRTAGEACRSGGIRTFDPLPECYIMGRNNPIVLFLSISVPYNLLLT